MLSQQHLYPLFHSLNQTSTALGERRVLPIFSNLYSFRCQLLYIMYPAFIESVLLFSTDCIFLKSVFILVFPCHGKERLKNRITYRCRNTSEPLWFRGVSAFFLLCFTQLLASLHEFVDKNIIISILPDCSGTQCTPFPTSAWLL